MRDNELLTSSSSLENETCVINTFFTREIKGTIGVRDGFVTKLPNGVLVLTTRESDKDGAPLELVVLLVPGLRRRLGRSKGGLVLFFPGAPSYARRV